MKSLLLIWVIFLAVPCQKERDFRVLSAVSYRILPGRAESMPVEEYEMILLAGRNAERLELTGLWVEQEKCPVRVSRLHENQASVNYSKGDTLRVVAGCEPPEPVTGKVVASSLPPEIREAEHPVLEYRTGRKLHYRVISFSDQKEKVLR